MKSVLLFEVIQSAVGVREKLNRNPSEKEWYCLFQMCKMQSIVGVVFNVLDSLCKKGQKPPLALLYDWIGQNEHIKQQNKIVNQNAVSLCDELNKDGFECCILKGQGNTLLYPNPFSRQPGDIDVWIREIGRNKFDVKNIIRYVKGRYPSGRAVYHHADMGIFNETEVEVHFRPSFMFNPIHNRRLQKWFLDKSDEQFHHQVELPEGVGSINVPTTEFNIIFQLTHIYNHVLHEGIGLRQIIDYYYLLRNAKDKLKIENGELIITLRYLGLEKIAGAMMWILSEILGLGQEYMIAPKNEKVGKVLLQEIMRGGNFGAYDIDNKKANNRLKKNLQRIKRDIRMMRYFPSECMWEPVFRVYHWMWRLRYN